MLVVVRHIHIHSHTDHSPINTSLDVLTRLCALTSTNPRVRLRACETETHALGSELVAEPPFGAACETETHALGSERVRLRPTH